MPSTVESKATDASVARAPVARPPDFIIIGAAKGGTTTLYAYLCRHPDLCLSRDKEPEFFAHNFDRGWAWYQSLFDHGQPGQRRGEASTVYTWAPDYAAIATRIATHAPQARLIYMLRHPVERLYSDYREQIKTAQIKGRALPELASFERFIDARPHLVQASEYIRFVRAYTEHFPPDALHCVLLEDLGRDPCGVLAQVCRHIGVPPDKALLTVGPVRANEARQYEQWQTRRRLTAWLRRVPGVQGLIGTVTPRAWREAGYRLLERTARGRAVRRALAPPPLTPAMRRKLIERYRPANAALAAYLGRDLSHWDA